MIPPFVWPFFVPVTPPEPEVEPKTDEDAPNSLDFWTSDDKLPETDIV